MSIGLQTLLKNTKHVKCGCDFHLDGRTRGPQPLGTVSPHPVFVFNPLLSLYMEPISFLPLILPKDHFTLYKKIFIRLQLEPPFHCCGGNVTLQGPNWFLGNVEGTSNLMMNRATAQSNSETLRKLWGLASCPFLLWIRCRLALQQLPPNSWTHHKVRSWARRDGT